VNKSKRIDKCRCFCGCWCIGDFE